MTTPRVHRETFLSNLRASGLLTPDELADALRDLPDSDRGRVVARELVARGVLTKFQAQQLLAGRTTGFWLGQYRILDLVGRGGMGRVFKAEHRTMKRVVALKILSGELTRTERARRLFQREVLAAAKLGHPNIVTAFDANEIDGRFFLVMEYVAGPNLSALVKQQGPLAVGQACEFVRQVALGLQHAHEMGLVHRDIKPSNLLVQPPVGQAGPLGGTIKIVDFGLARLANSGAEAAGPAEPQMVMGTPDFLSPEQGRDLNAVDIRSDLYSLGCAFYYLLTGRVPFPGGSSLDKLMRHASAEPEPIEEVRPIVPPGVAAIVRKLMAKSPGDRFQVPIELAVALEPFAESRPVVWTGRDDDESPSLSGTGELGGQSALSGPKTAVGALSGTQPVGELSTNLTPAELELLRGEDPPRIGNVTWFVLALLLGFGIGSLLIAMTFWVLSR